MDRSLHRPHARLSITALVLLLIAFATACRVFDRKLRVVLVTLDTVRYDAFESGDRSTSLPNTMAYASQGSVFTRAYAASNVTQPTHASLFTSLHPWEHGVTRNGMVLGDEFETVAEVLHAAGFATGAVVASFPLRAGFGFAQGFDSYREVFGRELVAGMRHWEGVEVPAGAFYSLADEVTEEALALLDDLGGNRQFFWFHFFDAHDPYGDTTGESLGLRSIYEARSEGDDRFHEALRQAAHLYRADLASLDQALGRLFERLESDAERIETHVVVTADHGENLGEHGHVGHGYCLEPQEIQVPLFIVSPRVPVGARVDVAGSIDVRPTLLSLAGVPVGGGRGRDLTLPAPTGGDVAFGMQRSSPQLALGMPAGDSREERDPERFFAARRGAVYAGYADELERVDGDRGEPPEPLARQLRILFRRFESSARDVSAGAVQDEETLEALQALGYAR